MAGTGNLPTHAELDRRIHDLETRIVESLKRADDALAASHANNRDLANLNAKMDAMREDLREIRKLGEQTVPRSELESKLTGVTTRTDRIESDLRAFIVEYHQNQTQSIQAQTAITDKIHRNTMATYGTLVTMGLAIFTSLLGFAGTLLMKSLGH